MLDDYKLFHDILGTEKRRGREPSLADLIAKKINPCFLTIQLTSIEMGRENLERVAVQSTL